MVAIRADFEAILHNLPTLATAPDLGLATHRRKAQLRHGFMRRFPWSGSELCDGVRCGAGGGSDEPIVATSLGVIPALQQIGCSRCRFCPGALTHVGSWVVEGQVVGTVDGDAIPLGDRRRSNGDRSGFIVAVVIGVAQGRVLIGNRQALKDLARGADETRGRLNRRHAALERCDTSGVDLRRLIFRARLSHRRYPAGWVSRNGT